MISAIEEKEFWSREEACWGQEMLGARWVQGLRLRAHSQHLPLWDGAPGGQEDTVRGVARRLLGWEFHGRFHRSSLTLLLLCSYMSSAKHLLWPLLCPPGDHAHLSPDPDFS